jgi:hypothetical protein
MYMLSPGAANAMVVKDGLAKTNARAIKNALSHRLCAIRRSYPRIPPDTLPRIGKRT